MDIAKAALYNLLIIKKFSATGAKQQIHALGAQVGGIGAIATASGQAALHLAICTLMGAGSHIVASTALYGGSQNLLHYTMRRFGIETTFVDARDVGARANGGAMRRRANERTSIAEGDDDDRERRTIERRGDADGDADDDANAGGGAGGSVRDRES